MSVEVLHGGLLTSLQDRGREGFAALGVGSAGALDAVSQRLANALVGNEAAAVTLELSLRGPRLRFDEPCLAALVGAEFALRLDGRATPSWQAFAIPAGAVLDCGMARRGAVASLAVRGGFAVPPVLGSRASDLNAGIGPLGGRALRTGDRLELAPSSPLRSGRDGAPNWSLDPRPWFDPDPERPLRLIPGSHFEALDRRSRRVLFEARFRVAPASNRVGFRLDGARLALAAPLEIASAPLACGSLQLPPGGQPIVLMVEHPTTGGYPRIGQLAAIDLPRLAQRRPGAALRFVRIDQDQAQTRYLARERALARLIDAIAERL